MENKKNIQIGLGETIITPKENLQMHGFGKSQVATGKHDDLHSRCLITKDALNNTAVIISISISEFMEVEYGNKLRNKISEAINVDKEAIMFSCTHTHSGPNVEDSSNSYQEFFFSQVIKSAEIAMENLAPGRIGIGKTVQLEVGKNRRTLLYGGMHPDPELVVLKIEDLSGKLRGILFNYGCHPATLDWRNTLYSEDWPYYAIKGIKEEVGKDIWVCYLQAAQGDINTGYSSLLSSIGSYMPVRDFAYIEYKGKQMSNSVLEKLKEVRTEDVYTVGTISKFYNLPLRQNFPTTLPEAEEKFNTAKKEFEKHTLNSQYLGTRKLDLFESELMAAEQTYELAKLFYLDSLPSVQSTEIQVFQIGTIQFFSLPGEIFSEIALKIKEQSPFNNTIAVGVANGYFGYMPTKEEYFEGDYEVNGCKYGPDAGNTFIEATVEVMNTLIKKGE